MIHSKLESDGSSGRWRRQLALCRKARFDSSQLLLHAGWSCAGSRRRKACAESNAATSQSQGKRVHLGLRVTRTTSHSPHCQSVLCKLVFRVCSASCHIRMPKFGFPVLTLIRLSLSLGLATSSHPFPHITCHSSLLITPLIDLTGHNLHHQSGSHDRHRRCLKSSSSSKRFSNPRSFYLQKYRTRASAPP